jgi:hypothetical protein
VPRFDSGHAHMRYHLLILLLPLFLKQPDTGIIDTRAEYVECDRHEICLRLHGISKDMNFIELRLYHVQYKEIKLVFESAITSRFMTTRGEAEHWAYMWGLPQRGDFLILITGYGERQDFLLTHITKRE